MHRLEANIRRFLCVALSLAIGTSLVLNERVLCRESSEDIDLEDSTTSSQVEHDTTNWTRFAENATTDASLSNSANPELNTTAYDNTSGCVGYSCYFRSSCGTAPLNGIKYRARSEPNVPFMSNGVDQVYGEWPSYARLMIRKNAFTSASCGGTLVSDYHILTAAHCAEGNPQSIHVFLGDHRVNMQSTQPDDPYEAVYKVKNICVAKNYRHSSGPVLYDYAVLTVEKRIQFTNYIQPACLPYGYIQGRTTFRSCFLVGSGVTRLGITNTQANFVQKMPMRQVSCADYGSYHYPALHSCFTKLQGGGDPCFGDSGGPVLCLSNTYNRWTVVAGVSHSRHNRCDPGGNYVAMFDRTTMMLPQIKKDCGI